MRRDKPHVFLGSSAEGLDVARAIQAELQYDAECEIWYQGTFGLGGGTLESLASATGRFDFAVLVLTGDDLAQSRGDVRAAPRDNVLFELGLFIGSLGRERTFMVVDRDAQVKLPSDLAGVTPAAFSRPNRGTLQAAVGPACTMIREAIQATGFWSAELPVRVMAGFYYVSDEQGVQFTIANVGRAPIPPFRIEICSSVEGGVNLSFLPLDDKAKGLPLLPEQRRSFRCCAFIRGRVRRWLQIVGPVLQGENGNAAEFRLVLEDSDRILYSHAGVGRGFAGAMAHALEHGTGGFATYDWRLLSNGQ